MKTPKIRSALVISALLIPVAAWGQTSGTTGSQTGQSSQSQRNQQTQPAQQPSQSSSDQWRQTDQQQRQHSSTSGSSAATGTGSMAGTASMGMGEIKRVERAELDNRLTASDLIGKDVIGSDGEKIGTVKDLSLAAVLPSSFEERGRAAASADSRPTTRASSPTTSASSATSTSSLSGASTSDSSNDVIVYVAVGGVMGVGGDLVSVPASQLRFDAQTEQLRMDRSSTEITTIAQAGKENDRSEAIAE
jgi:hypothetical protein